MFDLCREEGDGPVVSIDYHGTLTALEIDLALADIDAHPDEYDLDYDIARDDWIAPYRGFNVEHATRCTAHREDCVEGPGCDCDWLEWVYTRIDPDDPSAPSGDGVVVTRLVVDTTWGHRCYLHRHEPAVTGLPAEHFLGSESDDADPLPLVGGYLYVCRECSTKIADRRQRQVRLWMAEARRRRAAGVPDALLYA